jgi:hypothetical protein
MMNLLMMILNYGGHVRPLYTRCASSKGGLVRLQGAPPGYGVPYIDTTSAADCWSWSRDVS